MLASQALVITAILTSCSKSPIPRVEPYPFGVNRSVDWYKSPLFDSIGHCCHQDEAKSVLLPFFNPYDAVSYTSNDVRVSETLVWPINGRKPSSLIFLLRHNDYSVFPPVAERCLAHFLQNSFRCGGVDRINNSNIARNIERRGPPDVRIPYRNFKAKRVICDTGVCLEDNLCSYPRSLGLDVRFLSERICCGSFVGSSSAARLA